MPSSPMRRASRSLAAAVLAGALIPAGASHAATRSAAPDWNGVWVLAGTFMDKQDGTSPSAPGRVNPNDPRRIAPQPQFKGAYLDAFKASQKAEAEGKPMADTGAECLPQGMPRFWGGPYGFEIAQNPSQLNLFQEWNEQTRRIYLDARKHPEDADPTYNGHSVGHWDGQDLIVDTVGIRDDTGIGLRGRHSDAIHITERFKSAGPDLLDIE